jgi:FkbM family methyltransferase
VDPIQILDKFIQLNPLEEISKIAARREFVIQGQRNPEIRIKIIKKLIAEKIEHLDVGARDGIEVSTSPYSDVLSSTLVEPDPIEAKKLRGSGYRVIEQILSDVHGVQKKLYLARKRGVSSLFKPNMNVIKYYSPENGEANIHRFDTEEEVKINTTTISRLGKKLNINFDDIKMDTEGSELKILKGLGKQRPFFLKTEVEMVELYETQALFHDVLKFLYDLGYVMCDLNIRIRPHGGYYGFPTPTTGDFSRGVPFTGDAFFMADWMRLSGQEIIARNSRKWASTLVMRGYADIVEVVCSQQDVHEGNEILRILRS